LSNGTTYANPKFFRKLEEKLAKAQRILSRRTKGSSNWNKQRIKVARIHVNFHDISSEILVKFSNSSRFRYILYP
jgi:putative transposase